MKRDDAFWAKVDATGDCWLWTGYRRPNGYGEVRRSGVRFYAHRYALMQSGRELGPVVDHICHNPSCVRPEHLRSVTVKQNVENRGGLNSNNRSGIRGVSWDARHQRWRASVKHQRRVHAKSFASLAEAGAWAGAKRNELFTHNDADRASA